MTGRVTAYNGNSSEQRSRIDESEHPRRRRRPSREYNTWSVVTYLF